jgi:hypothetical protein
MSVDSDRAFVDSLARAVVLEVRPVEEHLFSAVSDAYWSDPRARPSGGGLRFDAAAVVDAVAPAALAVSAFALALLTDVAKKAALDAYEALKSRLRRSDGGPAITPVALSAAELARFSGLVAEEARRHLSDARAKELADAVLARLVCLET